MSLVVVSCGEPQRVLESGTMRTNGQVGDVVLRNVVVEAPPEHAWRPGDDATVRLTLLSRADRPEALVGVRTDAATRVEMWADRDCDGVSEPVDRIHVPAEGVVNEPGSVHAAYHLRIVGFTREVLAGTTVPLTFAFEGVGETTLDAMVEATGDGDVLPPLTCGSPSTSGPPTSEESPTSPSRPALTLSGRVQAGVEPGCLVLSTDRGQFLLLGADPEVVRAGAEVVVEGVARPDQMTTCQQGTPFTVLEARPVPTNR
ncbi:copper chaperone PCu(A)C [Saccharothrix deserti]|uniref:copper chaperone PCu(A)C n=1 Tax=Saccharothrix deserti TaxID=2593674 RepID=UPI00131CCD1A|nr:copper chaperone PCu(A)C [Saccharothrix deserti]